MQLEPNMYVRTNKGIAKVKKLDDLDNVAWTDNKNIFFGIKRPSGKLYFELYDDGTVLKASHNIIDLIEVGDYVNGERVLKTNCNLLYYDDELGEEQDVADALHLESSWIYWENEIETIVTKEQFEAMAYKVV